MPPAPVHSSVKVEDVEMGPLLAVPDVPLGPDQALDATQDVALVELQLSVLVPPIGTLAGETESVAVGDEAGGAVVCD